jgi:hypothetical protein
MTYWCTATENVAASTEVEGEIRGEERREIALKKDN